VGGNLAIVDKSYFLHERDEKGNLKPIVVEIEPGKEIKLIPIPEGEISMMADPSKGYEITSAHIVEPKISPEELRQFGKTAKIAKVVQKLLEISDTNISFRPDERRQSNATGGTGSPQTRI